MRKKEWISSLLINLLRQRCAVKFFIFIPSSSILVFTRRLSKDFCSLWYLTSPNPPDKPYWPYKTIYCDSFSGIDCWTASRENLKVCPWKSSIWVFSIERLQIWFKEHQAEVSRFNYWTASHFYEFPNFSNTTVKVLFFKLHCHYSRLSHSIRI